jgi:hypothetical protein
MRAVYGPWEASGVDIVKCTMLKSAFLLPLISSHCATQSASAIGAHSDIETSCLMLDSILGRIIDRSAWYRARLVLGIIPNL